VDSRTNGTLLVIGYGSLLSGYGLIGPRRKDESRLYARDAEPVAVRNARRGLAKWSSHGSYFAMDIEQIERGAPITGAVRGRDGGFGAMLLSFDRSEARKIAKREEYGADLFERLIDLADAEELPLAEYLLKVANETGHDWLAYRTELRKRVGATSPGYVFHPVPLDDGRTAIIAIGSGYEGSGDPEVISWRRKYGIERVMAIPEALAITRLEIDRHGQLEYIAECLLGGFHGLDIGDLAEALEPEAALTQELATRIARAAEREDEWFTRATSLDAERYKARFAGPRHPRVATLLKLGSLG
jgi:hypothetical protein